MNCYITNVFLKRIQEIQHFLAGTYLYVCLLDLKKRFPNITLIISFCWTSKRFLVWAFTYFWKYFFRRIFLVLQDTKSKLRYHFSMVEWSFLALQIDLKIRNELPKGGFDIIYSINLLLYHSVRYIQKVFSG